MSGSSARLSVVVCTFNRSRLLGKCLQSLADQTLDKTRYEIVIVDNNSTDDTQRTCMEFCRAQPNATAIVEKRQGLSHARNRGFQGSVGDFVAFIDDDAVAGPDWCEKILAAFNEVRPTPAAVGGPIYAYYETPPPKWFSDDMEIRSWGNGSGFLQAPRARNGFSGSNMAFRRGALAQVNGFSPLLGQKGQAVRFGEETQVFRLLYQREPYFWYDPGIKVYHFTPYRNMTIGYRLVRSLKMGQSSARIDNKRIFSLTACKTCAYLGVYTLSMPLYVLKLKENKQQFMVKRMEKMFSLLGYLLG